MRLCHLARIFPPRPVGLECPGPGRQDACKPQARWPRGSGAAPCLKRPRPRLMGPEPPGGRDEWAGEEERGEPGSVTMAAFRAGCSPPIRPPRSLLLVTRVWAKAPGICPCPCPRPARHPVPNHLLARTLPPLQRGGGYAGPRRTAQALAPPVRGSHLAARLRDAPTGAPRRRGAAGRHSPRLPANPSILRRGERALQPAETGACARRAAARGAGIR